ncbi:hypothetical protein EI94DRAFT_614436 [Lactarius quietus]|nr:hypothetical protein EI94DRAFT_614436 [Lactarius quietus]
MEAKSGRGFNHDILGRLLIPVQHIAEYDRNPISVRAKVNSGIEGYRVTAADAPAFLYEDLAKYNPDEVMTGLMRGYFLARCLRAIFTGPKTVANHLGRNQRPGPRSIAEKSGLKTVTVPIIVYVTIQARFALSDQGSWTGRDKAFDYEEFAETLFKIFELDDEWAAQTVRWWNKELFGNENGLRIAGVTPLRDPTRTSVLAMAKAQVAKRRAEKTAREHAAGELKLVSALPNSGCGGNDNVKPPPNHNLELRDNCDDNTATRVPESQGQGNVGKCKDKDEDRRVDNKRRSRNEDVPESEGQSQPMSKKRRSAMKNLEDERKPKIETAEPAMVW